MRVVIQRVNRAKVRVQEEVKGNIHKGLLILVGIESGDSYKDSLWLANKISNIRLFDDENGLMNKSIVDIGGEVIVVSQFTLHAKTRKGNRPSFIQAAPPDLAIKIYDKFKDDLSSAISQEVQSGEFGANMEVSLINDGPVTIIIDTKNKE
tara:strand:- start:1508 stop:1960 length:453 start_codon:yes stop_codon:yes gene_type:complete